MDISFRHASAALLLAACTLATGCASFPGEHLKSAAIPDTSAKAYRPSAYIDVKVLAGEPGSSSAVELPTLKAKAQGAVERALAANSPFSSYTFDAFQQQQADHVVRLHFYNHGEVGAGVLLGLLCGFSFGVIPAVATDHYTLLASVDKAEPEPKRSHDTVTTWMGLWFLPVASKTPEKAVMGTFEDLTRDGLSQLVAAGLLRFEAPGPVATPVAAGAATLAPTATESPPQPAPAPSPQQ